jgi:acetolactate synthase I/II/III large subunit
MKSKLFARPAARSESASSSPCSSGPVRLSSRPRPDSILPPSTVAQAFTRVFLELGVTHSFGVMGGAIAPLCETLARSSLRIIHCRHETGAAFAAIEAYFSTHRPCVLFTTTGPSLINAMNGIMAARLEGAKLIVLSGTTPSDRRGRWAFQETSSYTMPDGLFSAGAIFHYAVQMNDPSEMSQIARRLLLGMARPGGFVAHIGLPTPLQTGPVSLERLPRANTVPPLAISYESAARCAKMLSGGPFIIWAGFGARRAGPQLRAFAERTGARVMCSPRGRGIFPEDHPQFLGTTGFAAPGDAGALVQSSSAQRVLVLGSRLGEFTSMWDPRLIPPQGVIHVDIDPNVPGVAFPSVPTYAVQAEIGGFLTALMDHLPPYCPPALVSCGPPANQTEFALRKEGPVRPQALMRAIQKVIVDNSNAPIFVDCGNSFAWANNLLKFRDEGRFRGSVMWGSMGNAAAGIVGASLAADEKCVAIVGDGSMLMQNEISTAVQYRAKTLWIVLNDAQYGMIEQGMRRWNLTPVETPIPPVDFVAYARSLGADGVAVKAESELETALVWGMAQEQPFVIDVIIDRREVAPIAERVANLQSPISGNSNDTA